MTHEQAEAHLTGEDDMANRFLRSAADAIVARSTLSRDVAVLTAKLDEVSSAADTLTELKRNQEERIALLEAQLASALDSEAKARADLGAAIDTIAERQASIDLLDATVADRDGEIASLRADRDGWQAKSQLQGEKLSDVIGMLNGIRKIMGQGDLEPDPREEIEAACAPSPSASGASGFVEGSIGQALYREHIGDPLRTPGFEDVARYDDPEAAEESFHLAQAS